MLNKIRKNIIVITILSIIFYSILIFLNDYEQILDTKIVLSNSSLLFVFLFIVISLIAKFLRWHIYLSYSLIKLSLSDSIMIFCSGLIMSISPGKLGELIKAYLIKKKYDIPISKTSPIILAERIVEFISLILLFGIGVIFYSQTYFLLLILVIAFFLTTIIIFRSIKIQLFLKRLFEKFDFTKGKIEEFGKIKNNLSKLFQPKILIIIFLISLVAWYFEILAFTCLINELGRESSWLFSVFAYSGSVIAGAVSMIPAGLFTTELSIMYFLQQIDISNNNAVLIILVIRFATLWFSVFIGIISYLLFVRLIRK